MDDRIAIVNALLMRSSTAIQPFSANEAGAHAQNMQTGYRHASQ
jgi:hypothetical protein